MNNDIITRSNERVLDEADLFLRSQEKMAFDLRVASPAIIQSVDFEKQTLTAKLAIRERFLNSQNKQYEFVEVPELLDVPFFFASGGDYSMTFPIKEGEECLVIFADSCIDAWWQNGDIQNPMRRRRHSLSDSFALVGFRSQPKKLENYSSDSLQIRKADGSVHIELKDDDISLYAENGNISAECKGELTLKADKIKLEAPSGIELAGNNQTKIDGKTFLQHTHSNGNEGANTGGVI